MRAKLLSFAIAAVLLGTSLAWLAPSGHASSFGLSLQDHPPASADSLHYRALSALNLFEIWAFGYPSPDAGGALLKVIRCEPRTSPHSCHPGTVPPCLMCNSGPLPAPADAFRERHTFLSVELTMLQVLDSATRAFPYDAMLKGIQVYHLTRRGDLEAALQSTAPAHCMLEGSSCAFLRGHVLQRMARTAEAEAVLSAGIATTDHELRCDLLDASVLLDVEQGERYARMSCDERMREDAIYWWLSDPSWLVPGNDRWVEHASRGAMNRFLKLYRNAAVGVDSAIWLAGAVPYADSVQYHSPRHRSHERPAGPWRWHDELTRFGSFDAIHILGGDVMSDRTASTYTPLLRDQKTGFSMGGTKTFAIDCPEGFEARTMLLFPADPSQVRFAEPWGTVRSNSYPQFLPPNRWPTGYRWSDSQSRSCMRVYNTRARHQFTPVRSVVSDPILVSSASYEILGSDSTLYGSLPAREQYSPPYLPIGAPFAEIEEYQIARFPRGRDSMLVVSAFTTPEINRFRNTASASRPSWVAGAVIANEFPPKEPADETVARSTPGSLREGYLFTQSAPLASLVVGLELLTPDTIGFARMREGLALGRWLSPGTDTRSGTDAISDILLFVPDSAMVQRPSELPGTLEEVAPRMKHTSIVQRGEALGLFWETGLPITGSAADSNLTVEIEVERLGRVDRRGVLGGVAQFFFGRARGGTASIRWTVEPRERAGGTAATTGPQNARRGDAFILDTTNMEPDSYMLRLTVSTRDGGRKTLAAERKILVR